MVVPEYIEVRNPQGQTVAFLSPQADGLRDCVIDLKLNGEAYISFELPLTSPKWQYLVPQNRIVAGGREFVIATPENVEHERDGRKLWGRVRADESWVLLGKKFKTISNDPTNPNPPDLAVLIVSGGTSLGGPFPVGSAGHALYALLDGTGWSVGTVDVSGTFDLETEKESILANINRVQELWGGFLVWDSINKTLSLRDETAWQEYRGFQIRYRKNLKGITRTVDCDIITRLWPFGEDDLDIASVNGGIKYLEDFSYTTEVLEGIWRDQSIGDPAQLKAKAQQVLAKVSKPRYNYRVQMVDLRTLPEWAHEDFKLGDMVDVIDEEMGISVRLRIIRHRYNVFQPWKCEVEIGDPVIELKDLLASSAKASEFVKSVLSRNPSLSNLWKGFVDAFATEINTRRGKLIWTGDVLEAIEVDADGAPTGRRVRITPGGIGVSTDGGQTYRTAVTGLGVLANTVIVNELYALATDDGLTKLAGDGLHVYDRNQIERLIAGRWLEGAEEHFGLRVKAQDGQTVLLDDRGLLQTWQEGYPVNVGPGYPAEYTIYIPPETRLIRRALLRFKFQKFRAHGKAAASSGGTTVTSSTTTTLAYTSALPFYDPPGTTSDVGDTWLGTTYMDEDGFHSHSGTTGPVDQGNHNHGIVPGTWLATADGGSVQFVASHGSHTHSFTTGGAGSHSHGRWVAHRHQYGIPGHNHSVSVPDHSHAIEYGIYEGSLPASVTVEINGVDRTSELGGPFSSDQAGLDIAPFLLIGQWNTIRLGSSQLGRLDAKIFVQILVGV